MYFFCTGCVLYLSEYIDNPNKLGIGVHSQFVACHSGFTGNGMSAIKSETWFLKIHFFCVAQVAWLMDNYETAEGVSLPRSTLYNHYMRHCNEHKLDAVNAASFGKLIRSVFTGLRTRRLGTRGNSKYHYYGIRVKPGSGLVSAVEDQPKNATTTSCGTGSSNATSTRIRKAGTKPETYEACSQVRFKNIT